MMVNRHCGRALVALGDALQEVGRRVEHARRTHGDVGFGGHSPSISPQNRQERKYGNYLH